VTGVRTVTTRNKETMAVATLEICRNAGSGGLSADVCHERSHVRRGTILLVAGE